MSSSCGSVCLLVLFGAVLAFGNPVQNPKQTLESIADVLELKRPEISSNPLFTSVIRSINTSCQRKEEVQLMNVTLSIYSRIFSNILQHNNNNPTLLERVPDSERHRVKSALNRLKGWMEREKTRLSQLNHNMDQDVLRNLNEITVDDPEVQRKALAQLVEIYQAAHVIGSHSCGHAHSNERR